jgi:hypothetical protein
MPELSLVAPMAVLVEESTFWQNYAKILAWRNV